jgi:hypothetical protein
LDAEINIKKDKLNADINTFNHTIEKFFNYHNKEQSKIKMNSIKLEKRENLVSKREEKVEHKEKVVKQREHDVLETQDLLIENIRKHRDEKKEFDKKIKRQLLLMSKIDEQQQIEDQRLRKWLQILKKNGFLNQFTLPCPQCKKPMYFDASQPEIQEKIKPMLKDYVHRSCNPERIQSTTHVTVHPVSYSSGTIIQSEGTIINNKVSPTDMIIQSESVYQSGYSPIMHSGRIQKQVKVVLKPSLSTGKPSIQSGKIITNN